MQGTSGAVGLCLMDLPAWHGAGHGTGKRCHAGGCPIVHAVFLPSAWDVPLSLLSKTTMLGMWPRAEGMGFGAHSSAAWAMAGFGWLVTWHRQLMTALITLMC